MEVTEVQAPALLAEAGIRRLFEDHRAEEMAYYRRTRIRQKFEEELAKRGLTSDIPQEAYANRDYEWEYADED